MFRRSDPQALLFSACAWMPKTKQERCAASWAGVFREKSLPILRRVEGEFADLYHPEKGRPNRPVELILAVLIFNLTYS